MRRSNWPVEDHGIRPAGSPDRCFYCAAAKGEQHRAGCVIRSRTVVVRMTVDYVVDAPEDWHPEQIEFQRNEGSWCSDNGVEELVALADRLKETSCTCDLIHYVFVREATAEDEQASLVFVDKLPT